MTYDTAGNITADPRFRNMIYGYDANGRQNYAAEANGSGPVTAVFDGAGQRVANKASGVLTIMVYDAGGKLVAEYGATAPTTANLQYVTADYQGSTRVVTTSSGVVANRRDYLPFGEEIGAGVGSRTTDKSFSQADMVRQKYAGMETDDATGMAHTLWRKQDNFSGRWTSPDPYGGSMTITDPQSFNRYTYCVNDPVNQVDPLGLQSGADASQSWGDVAGLFWGESFDFNGSHFGGPETIGAAIYGHDSRNKTRLAQLREGAKPKENMAYAYCLSDDVDTVTVNIYAFISREAAIAYYRKLYGPKFVFAFRRYDSYGNGKPGLAFTGWMQRAEPGSARPAIGRYSPSRYGLFGVNWNVFGGAALGRGVAGNVGGSVGLNTNGNGGVGAAGTVGTFIGGSAVPGSYGYPSNEGVGLGAAISFGPGLFWSNAESFKDLQGDFATTVVATPLFTLDIDSSGPIKVIGLSGPSIGAGIFHYKTNTPKWSTPEASVLIPLSNY